MPDLMAQLRDYVSTPLGLVVMVTTALMLIALPVSLILLWSAKTGSRNERLAKAIMTGGGLLAIPIVALAVLPNVALSAVFMVVFVIEAWLMFNPAARARNRRRTEALADLARTAADIKERETEERAQAHARELKELP